MAIRSAFRPLTRNEAAGFVDDAEADGADGVQQMGACTLSRDAFRFSDGVELKAATQVCVRARSTVARRYWRHSF